MEALCLVTKKNNRKFGQLYQIILIAIAVLLSNTTSASEADSLLQKRLTISIKPATLFKVLNQIGEKAGCYFIYDSRDVDSKKRVKKHNFINSSLYQILTEVINDSLVKFKAIDRHILLYRDRANRNGALNDDKERFIKLKGRIVDKESGTPIQYATIGIPSLALGTITNQDGVFNLSIPNLYIDSTLIISHIGYEPYRIRGRLIQNETPDILLKPTYISIQEIIIRNIDARGLVAKAVKQRLKKYLPNEVYITSFYREGVLKNGNVVSYSEAVSKIYKSPYRFDSRYDQVKLLRYRKIEQKSRQDTLEVKLKAGVRSSLDLDIMKNLPDFLNPDFMEYYEYSRNDIVVFNNRTAYVIGFKQKDYVKDPLFTGVIYIDTEDFVILGADFEINPKLVKKTTNQIVVKRGRKVRVKPQRIRYHVLYEEHDNYWFAKHIRGDIEMKVSLRFLPFSNSYNVFFELVGIDIENENVKRFKRKETLKSNVVLSDISYEYDPDFWDGLNFIEPETDIIKSMRKFEPKIEKITSEIN
jgi:hypothetical protein